MSQWPIIKIKSQLYVFNCVCFKDLINFLLVIMQINVNANANACSLETFYWSAQKYWFAHGSSFQRCLLVILSQFQFHSVSESVWPVRAALPNFDRLSVKRH